MDIHSLTFQITTWRNYIYPGLEVRKPTFLKRYFCSLNQNMTSNHLDPIATFFSQLKFTHSHAILAILSSKKEDHQYHNVSSPKYAYTVWARILYYQNIIRPKLVKSTILKFTTTELQNKIWQPVNPNPALWLICIASGFIRFLILKKASKGEKKWLTTYSDLHWN